MGDWYLKDPLHEILERHLFRSSTEDENLDQMINSVIADYLLYLDSQGVHVPSKMKSVLVDDLKDEIREQIVRKTYGSVSIRVDSTTQAGLLRPRSARKMA